LASSALTRRSAAPDAPLAISVRASPAVRRAGVLEVEDAVPHSVAASHPRYTNAHRTPCFPTLRPAPALSAAGFDPLGFGSDPAKMATLQMKELANGRLAMFAFSGEQAHRLHHASWPRTSHALGRLMLRARIPLCRHGDPVGPHRQ